MSKLIKVISLAIVGLFSTLLVANSAFANEVNVFSARHYDSDVQLYEKFTAKTELAIKKVPNKPTIAKPITFINFFITYLLSYFDNHYHINDNDYQ